MNPIIDFSNSDIAFPLSDTLAIDTKGNPLMRIGDNMAIDLNTGEPHFISGWTGEDDHIH